MLHKEKRFNQRIHWKQILFFRIWQRIGNILAILSLPILVCWIKIAPAEQHQPVKTAQPVKTTIHKQHSIKHHHKKTAHSSHPRKTVQLIDKTTPKISVIASKKLVQFIDNTVYNLNYSSYKLGGERFDTNKGIYIIDCSRFVDRVLKKTYPNAYHNLVNATGTNTPTTQHYYSFFNELPEKAKKHTYWNYVSQIKQLRPGDILVFRYKNLAGRKTAGHMMVIMNKPIRASSHTFFVRVADSAPVRHSEDTRLRSESGIGIGTLLLKLNPSTGKPTAYAWEKGGVWKHNVKFAMARPIKFNV